MLDRLEQALERLVEGSVAGVFRLRVQPADIGRQLERAMLDGRMTSVGATLAPNYYEINLHPDDASTFAGWEEALCREMEVWLADLAFARGLATVGPVRVVITVDDTVARRSVRATSRFADVVARSFQSTGAPPARLTLVSIDRLLPDVELVDRSMTVGRSENNDLILPDATVSRHHARLELDSGVSRWTVVDLSSTNGTWVNGVSVERTSIAPGDLVAFASVNFRVQPNARPHS